MAVKTSKASTPRPDSAVKLQAKHEAFVQAYVSNGMNATEAYKAVYPKYGSDAAARANAARLIANDNIAARIEEILAAGAERAEITVEKVLRELAVLGFSDIGNVLRWRPEITVEEVESEEEGQPVRQVMVSRVMVVDSEKLPADARLAVSRISQSANGTITVQMHDKHGPLVSIGKHLGMFVDQVQIRARYAISDQPMSAEEWKKQYVREG